MILRLMFLVLYFFVATVQADSLPEEYVDSLSKTTSDKKWFESLSKSYAKSKNTTMKVTKTVFYSLMDETKKFKGKVYLQKENIRLDLESTNSDSDGGKNITLIKGKKVWITDLPVKSSELAPRVVISSLEGSGAGLSKKVLSSLLSGKNIEKYFKTVSVKKSSEKKMKRTVKLKPKSKFSEMKSVVLNISNKGLIEEVSYTDELENKTTFTFSKIKFSTKIDAKIFVFSAPKNAEITTL